jgi:hypothetical protein
LALFGRRPEKCVVNTGVIPANAKSNQIIELNQKELARLPRQGTRTGPKPDQDRGTAAAVRRRRARGVDHLRCPYDVPQNPDVGVGTSKQTNDGSDWSLGTTSRITLLQHDGGMDLDGNLWFTSNAPNKLVTIGRVDTKTGGVKFLKVNRTDGRAATRTQAKITQTSRRPGRTATRRRARRPTPCPNG